MQFLVNEELFNYSSFHLSKGTSSDSSAKPVWKHMQGGGQ